MRLTAIKNSHLMTTTQGIADLSWADETCSAEDQDPQGSICLRLIDVRRKYRIETDAPSHGGQGDAANCQCGAPEKISPGCRHLAVDATCRSFTRRPDSLRSLMAGHGELNIVGTFRYLHIIA